MYQEVYERGSQHLGDAALEYFGRKFTYGELIENICKVSEALKRIGIKKDDTVTLMTMCTPEAVFLIYGLNKIGAVCNLVYITLTAEELKNNLETTDSKAIFFLDYCEKTVAAATKFLSNLYMCKLTPQLSMPAYLKIFGRRGAKQNAIHSYNEFIADVKPRDAGDFVTDDFLPAVYVYTSGTTGAPKAVALNNTCINSIAYQYGALHVIEGPRESFFNSIPPFFAIGFAFGLHMPLVLGLKEILWIIPEPEKAAGAFLRNKPTHFLGPIEIIEAAVRRAKKMNYAHIISTGGVSPGVDREIELSRVMKERGCPAPFLVGYGLTECSGPATANTPYAYKPGSLGIPFPYTNIMILDDDGYEVGIREQGEIYISSPGIMQGYRGDEEATDDMVYVDKNNVRWLRTGDLGYVDEDGFVFFVGRKKRIYATRWFDGIIYKWFPQRIEEECEKISFVKQCAVVSVDDEELLTRPIAFVSYEEGTEHGDVIKELKKVLPKHSIPKEVIEMKGIPMTLNGKKDYRKIMEEYEKSAPEREKEET